MVIAAASQLLGALGRIFVCQATMLFISIISVCQWLASVYAGINKHWEENCVVRHKSSRNNGTWILCIHEVIAFLLFSIYFLFMCDSKNLALQYPSFHIMSLIFFSIKLLVSGVKSSLFADFTSSLNSVSFPTSKIWPPSHIWTTEIQHKLLLPCSFREVPSC